MHIWCVPFSLRYGAQRFFAVQIAVDDVTQRVKMARKVLRKGVQLKRHSHWDGNTHRGYKDELQRTLGGTVAAPVNGGTRIFVEVFLVVRYLLFSLIFSPAK